MAQKVGLALGGGGARGLAHIGVLQILEEENIPIDIIAGTSIGSIVGSLYAYYMNSGVVKQKFMEFMNTDIFKRMGFARIEKSNTIEPSFIQQFAKIVSQKLVIKLNAQTLGLISKEKMHTFLTKILNNITFESCQIPFGALASNLNTGDGHLFTEGNLIDSVQASSSIPGWVEPITINGDFYSDGIIYASVPTNCLRDMGADIVIAVDVTKRNLSSIKIESALDVVSLSEHLMKNRLTDIVLGFSDIVIRPDTKGFDWYQYTHYDELIYEGREATRKMLPEIKKLITS